MEYKEFLKTKQQSPMPDNGDQFDIPDYLFGHPLQLDVIDRAICLRSNPGETVLTPFMGVGSEVFSAVVNHRRGIGIELKTSYYRQAVKNMEAANDYKREDQSDLVSMMEAGGE